MTLREYELRDARRFGLQDVLLAFGAFVDGRPLDAVSWLLVAGFMWAAFDRTREQRRLTEPVKTPVRLGPPEEWIP